MQTKQSENVIPAVSQAENMAFIRIYGEEAQKFLQGQLTVDVASLSVGDIRYSAQCDAKGKMVGLGYLVFDGNSYWFIQDKGSIANSLAQLQKFGVFSKADFELSPDNVHCIALLGDQHYDGETVLETPYLPNLEQVKLVWTHTLPEEVSSSVSFNSILVKQGVAMLGQDMAEQWVPQMMNVQALSGIDFDKGCYMGQEVVARTKYLGKNKRAMYTYSMAANSDEMPNAGDPVLRQLGENWRKAGTVVNAARLQDTLWVSVVLPNDVTEQDVIKVGGEDAPTATFSALPYVIESETSSVKMRKRHD